MKKTDFAAKYKHPDWQKKRLEILQRDDFKCQKCGDTETQLHVHHLYYVKDRDPWNYPNLALLTLCATCHETADVGNEIYAWEHLLEFLAVKQDDLYEIFQQSEDVFCDFRVSQTEMREAVIAGLVALAQRRFEMAEAAKK